MKHLALIPGDGIGKEVTEVGMDIIDAISEISSFKYDAELFDIGSERYLRSGELITEEDFDDLGKKDAIYFGAIGDPRVRPGVLEKGILLNMRSRFDQYINLRPVTSWHPFVPLKKHFDFDICFLRENTEDFYMGAGGTFSNGKDATVNIKRRLYDLRVDIHTESSSDDVFAFELGMLSRKGVERFADHAFMTAVKRNEKKITLVDKANVCTSIYGMQREIFSGKAEEYGIELECMYVDAMAMAMVVRPHTFGTVAVPNLFGDILTDLGAQLQGGLGMGASGNINPTGVSMFEPIHGSAPDIAGQGKANPIAAVLAAKMMLDHLGHEDMGTMIQDAVRRCLDDGKYTADLGGKLTTRQMGAEIRKEILGAKR
ncbi:MAG: isocitrate/isopropylmalate dehydrogenase family protein [Methanomassiliicoccaceae archaeon]|jgi:3-isopropylmalate dehydrogenase|nr:isocitrate/isopropylmalate dehydrogenase family protein [Methanomassiliicoccaceae archaeon]